MLLMRSLKDRIKESGRVFVFGIAGDSGSGKTTISRGIRRILGEEMVATFSMDDYHCLDREERKERNITPLHPDANQFDLLAEHLETLRRNEKINKPVYDHSTGKITGTVPFGPAPVIIVEGLHTLYTQRLRDQIDFKIFVDPSRSVKRLWKIRRDVGDRGYEATQVMAEILQREPDYKLYVDIQKIYAEIVIKIQDSRFRPSLLESESTLDWYSVRLIMDILEHPVSEVGMNIDLSKILHRSEHEFSIEFQRDDYYGKRVGIMTVDGEIHQSMIAELERTLGESLGTGGMISDRREEYVNAIGLAQLILTWNGTEKLNYLLQKEGY